MENSRQDISEKAAVESWFNVSSLNCIDLSILELHKSVPLVKQACLETGFFYVINHGISQELIDEVLAQSKKFFSQPSCEKMKLLRNELFRGYTPMLDDLSDPENQVDGDYNEAYYIGVEIAKDDPAAKKPFSGPNIWPSSDILPGWRETMEKYYQQTSGVARRVARIIALALDLEEGYFDSPENLGEHTAKLRLIHYFKDYISEPGNGIFGTGAHSDYGMLTLLASDDVAGLQICKDTDIIPQKWENVTPLKGAFVVNIGNLLERWSNGIFKSTAHRVVGIGQDRYSVAFFMNPSHDCVVKCLPTCQSPENPPKFPPIKCVTYMQQKYAQSRAHANSYG